MKTRKTFFLMLSMLPLFFLIIPVNNALAAKEGEEMPISITLKARWSGCDGSCDGKTSSNRVDSGNYTINISGTMVTKRGDKEIVTYKPKSLTGTYSVQSTTQDIANKECQKCNPVETIKGASSIAFGKDPKTIAAVQAFTGTLGAATALQLKGELGPGYEKTVPSMKERRIISFVVSAPVTMAKAYVDSCKTCVRNPETLDGGFAININADMTTRKTGSLSWKSKEHPLTALGAAAIDLGDYVVPENEPQGKAEYTLTWSLGEALPAKLKLKEVHFNYDGNKDNRVVLINHVNNTEIKAPEWTAQGEKKSAAFIRNKPFKVKAIFSVEGTRIERAEIWADEEITDKQSVIKKGFDGLQRTMVEFAEGETEKEVEFTIESPQSLISVNNVRWLWCADIWYKGSEEPETDIDIKTAGTQEAKFSEHTIYIVDDKPDPKTTTFEFAVKKGCQWAEGKQGKDAAFKAIWEKFIEIPCPEETPCSESVLAYAHSKVPYMSMPGGSPFTSLGLLQQGSGTCGAWQEFFADVVGSQGIAVTKITILPKKELGIMYMIVAPGPAQGNIQPVRFFGEHAIVQYGNNFYDPSYKIDKPVSSTEPLSKYESDVFMGYCLDTDPVIDTCFQNCRHFKQPNDLAECLMSKCNCRKNNPQECEVTVE